MLDIDLSVLPSMPLGLDSHGEATWPAQDVVIIAYGSLGTLAKAAEACGIPKTTVYHWEGRDYLGFVARLGVGKRMYRDYLEDLVHQRLSDPQGNRGSDVLLMGALNANHPDKWSRNIQVTHEVGREVMATLQKIQQQQDTRAPSVLAPLEPWKLVDGSATVVDADAAKG